MVATKNSSPGEKRMNHEILNLKPKKKEERHTFFLIFCVFAVTILGFLPGFEPRVSLAFVLFMYIIHALTDLYTLKPLDRRISFNKGILFAIEKFEAKYKKKKKLRKKK